MPGGAGCFEFAGSEIVIIPASQRFGAITMDHEGKLDRSAKNLDRLIAHGEERGWAFLAARKARLAASPKLKT